MTFLSKKLIQLTSGLAFCLLQLHAAHAALPVGADAPGIQLPAVLAGKGFHFNLQEALKKGPVVVYFYPAAFSSGCTVEAHLFAEAHDKFQAAGATVVGVSNDNIETLDKFSTSACGGKFAVAADPGKVAIAAYDATSTEHPGYAQRISYVITPNQKVLYTLTAADPALHVEGALKAVQTWHDHH